MAKITPPIKDRSLKISHKQASIKNAERTLCQRTKPYAMNIANGLWLAGSGIMAAADRLGGTPLESLVGAMIFAAESSGVLFSKIWKPIYNIQTFLFMFALALQWGEKMMQSPTLFIAMGALFTGNIPAILEYPVAKKAKKLLAEFKTSGQSLVSKTYSKTKKLGLWCFANPRHVALNTNFIYSSVCLGFALSNKEWHMVPVYALWMAGNITARFSEEITPLNPHPKTRLPPKRTVGVRRYRRQRARKNNLPFLKNVSAVR
jgi:hypothetical protein